MNLFSESLRRAAVLTLGVVTVAPILASDSPRSLREVLTADEFRRAGLEKLTEAELAYLGGLLLPGDPSVAQGTSSANAVPERSPEPTPAIPTTENERSVETAAREKVGPAAQTRAPASPETVPAAMPAPDGELQGEAAFGMEERIRQQVEQKHRIPSTIASRIIGRFRGWDGTTVFRLENGQVWKQIAEGEFYVVLEDPVVTIEKGAFGAFFLGVEGYGARVKVKRVK